jgi:hypothetical protein
MDESPVEPGPLQMIRALPPVYRVTLAPVSPEAAIQVSLISILPRQQARRPRSRCQTKPHRRWPAGLSFEQAVRIVGGGSPARGRRRIEAMLPDRTLAPIVAALQTMRGMALVNAATLIAELGDLARFANPRQLVAYLGLVPSEHSSGASVKRGGLTKAGNSGPVGC